jgi:hypothetical protein
MKEKLIMFGEDYETHVNRVSLMSQDLRNVHPEDPKVRSSNGRTTIGLLDGMFHVELVAMITTNPNFTEIEKANRLKTLDRILESEITERRKKWQKS